jgi:hypothetical protein
MYFDPKDGGHDTQNGIKDLVKLHVNGLSERLRERADVLRYVVMPKMLTVQTDVAVRYSVSNCPPKLRSH